MVIAPASRSNKWEARSKSGKIAGGLRARRGSSPFPGANLNRRKIIGVLMNKRFLLNTFKAFNFILQQEINKFSLIKIDNKKGKGIDCLLFTLMVVFSSSVLA